MTVNSAGYQVEIPEYHTNLASKRYQIVHESLYLQKTLCDIVDLSKDWRLKSLNVAGHTLQWSSFQHSANLFFKCNTVQGLWSLCSEKKYADHVSKSTMSAPCLNQPTRERHGGEGLRFGSQLEKILEKQSQGKQPQELSAEISESSISEPTSPPPPPAQMYIHIQHTCTHIYHICTILHIQHSRHYINIHVPHT